MWKLHSIGRTIERSARVVRRPARIMPNLCRLAWVPRSLMLRAGFPLTAGDRRLAEKVDLHRGQRCFVIGNGPSLCMDDLNLLREETTFGLNRVFLAFDRTKWRPTYYVAVDLLMHEQHKREIEALGMVKFLPVESSRLIEFDTDTIPFCDWGTDERDDGPKFSTDIRRCTYGGWTVAYTALQIAYSMGFTRVVLLGIDNVWKGAGEPMKHSQIPNLMVSSGGGDHFHPAYDKPGNLYAQPRPDLQRRAFVAAKHAFEADGRVIVNATRGGKLDVFPLTTLETELRRTGTVKTNNEQEFACVGGK